MLSYTRSIRVGGMIEIVCKCCDTGSDAIIPFGPSTVCCLRPIYCLNLFASRFVFTEIFDYDIVHVQIFGSGDKMNAIIASPYFVDLIACAVEVFEKLPVRITRLWAEGEVDLETFNKSLFDGR